ncbi:MAG TPA: sialidase family protein [Rhodocyclaceae bacterium]
MKLWLIGLLRSLGRWLLLRREDARALAHRRWLPLAVFALAVGVALPWLRPLAAPRFVVADNALPLPAARHARAESHLIANPAAAAHSASLADLGGGQIGAVWFAGSKEGAADVAIVMARFDGYAWSNAQTIMTRQQVQHDTQRLIRKLGNPVLWRDGNNLLHLWFVSVSWGGWAGSAVNHSTSNDGGNNWSPVQRLITSPFWNLSTLVHGAPLPLTDGGVALPVYHEFFTKHPEWLRLDGRDRVQEKQRLPGSRRLFQPTAATLDGERALALLRDAGGAHRIHLARSEDGGAHWQAAQATDLPNPDAGIALLHLADGRLLLAYNPQESNRTQLALSVSSDEGASWSPPHFIEQGSGEDEFSYPALLQDERGMIHLAYTFKRQQIKHLTFGPAWLSAHAVEGRR